MFDYMEFAAVNHPNVVGQRERSQDKQPTEVVTPSNSFGCQLGSPRRGACLPHAGTGRGGGEPQGTRMLILLEGLLSAPDEFRLVTL